MTWISRLMGQKTQVAAGPLSPAQTEQIQKAKSAGHTISTQLTETLSKLQARMTTASKTAQESLASSQKTDQAIRNLTSEYNKDEASAANAVKSNFPKITKLSSQFTSLSKDMEKTKAAMDKTEAEAARLFSQGETKKAEKKLKEFAKHEKTLGALAGRCKVLNAKLEEAEKITTKLNIIQELRKAIFRNTEFLVAFQREGGAIGYKGEYASSKNFSDHQLSVLTQQTKEIDVIYGQAADNLAKTATPETLEKLRTINKVFNEGMNQVSYKATRDAVASYDNFKFPDAGHYDSVNDVTLSYLKTSMNEKYGLDGLRESMKTISEKYDKSGMASITTEDMQTLKTIKETFEKARQEISNF